MLSVLDRRRETRVIAETFGEPTDSHRQNDRSILPILRTSRHWIGGGRSLQPNPDVEVVIDDSAVDNSCDSHTANLDTGLTRQELALLTAATRLKCEFADTFDAETIEQCLHSSYDRLAWRAKVLAFLPLLAERLARQHLRMLAAVEEPTTNAEPSVLFPSFGDARRSPAALAPSATLSGFRPWTAAVAAR